MSKKKIVLLLAAGHGINDLTAGYFLGVLVQNGNNIAEAGIGLIIYNLLAFGGQYHTALFLEKIKSPKLFLLVSYGLNITAIILFPFMLPLSIILAGIASALYHVAGGTVCAQENKAADIGLFAAPGVAGLIAGGYFAYEKIGIYWWLLGTALSFFVLLFRLSIEYKKSSEQAEPADKKAKSFALDQHDIIMILLLTIISLRSVIWNVFQLIHESNYYWLIAIAVSAFIGKIGGGWVADRIGWRLYMISSLVIATPLITFFKKEMVLFCAGIGLLQSGIPATTALLIQSMKGKTERAVGLAFGFTIIAGALIFYTSARTRLYSWLSVLIIAAIMLLLMFVFIKKVNKSGYFSAGEIQGG
ncbi:MAG TPA: hypothetical protein VI461_07915 [Chitinophagaceae bacterium]|nr:hypothetical protein [Chitinophagaceae bacterium]